MKNLLPFYLIVSLLVLSSCNPVLYQPNSPNIPFVDSSERTNIKVSASFRNQDLQFSRLMKSNNLIQASITRSDAGFRYSLGTGEINFKESKNTFYTYGLSFTNYTKKERWHFNADEFIGPGNNFPSSSIIKGQQIMGKFMIGSITPPKTNPYESQSATALEFELCFAPKIIYTTTHRTINEPYEWSEDGQINNHLYGIISIHQSFTIYRTFSLTIGSRISIRGLKIPEEIMYYSTELIYLKAGIVI